jgi:hypothetical protein
MALIIAKVLDVERKTYGKENKTLAEVSLKSGGELFSVSLFDGDIKAGKDTVYKNMIGKMITVDVSADIYRDKLQYRLGFDLPEIYQEKAPLKAAG